MSIKLSSAAKFVGILTILGCIIPTIYLNVFSESFLLHHGLSHSGTATICGFLCLLGIIGGIAGIFDKKASSLNKRVCILGTLLCLIFFLYAFVQFGTAREGTRRISCASNMKCFMLAFRQYAIDYAGNYPSSGGAAGFELLRKYDYLTDYAVYTCPSTQTARGSGDQPLTEEIIDYVYIGGLNEKSSPRQPLMYDKPNNHGNYYGNVLFTDGTVERIEGKPWTANIKK